jgi:hypothetical protein
MALAATYEMYDGVADEDHPPHQTGEKHGREHDEGEVTHTLNLSARIAATAAARHPDPPPDIRWPVLVLMWRMRHTGRSTTALVAS